MGALIGFFTDYQHNKWLNQLLSGTPYTPPTSLYVGLSKNIALKANAFTEPPLTQTIIGFTDFAIDGSDNTKISSVSHPFVAADKSIVITGGNGWTSGTYTIGSISGSQAVLNSSPGAVGVTSGLGNIIRNTGYVRTLIPSGAFNLSVVGTTQNNVDIVLPAPTGDWGTLKAMGIFDSLTGGNLLAVIALTVPIIISAGDPARTIVAGALAVSKS